MIYFKSIAITIVVLLSVGCAQLNANYRHNFKGISSELEQKIEEIKKEEKKEEKKERVLKDKIIKIDFNERYDLSDGRLSSKISYFSKECVYVDELLKEVSNVTGLTYIPIINSENKRVYSDDFNPFHICLQVKEVKGSVRDILKIIEDNFNIDFYVKGSVLYSRYKYSLYVPFSNLNKFLKGRDEEKPVLNISNTEMQGKKQVFENVVRDEGSLIAKTNVNVFDIANEYCESFNSFYRSYNEENAGVSYIRDFIRVDKGSDNVKSNVNSNELDARMDDTKQGSSINGKKSAYSGKNFEDRVKQFSDGCYVNGSGFFFTLDVNFIRNNKDILEDSLSQFFRSGVVRVSYFAVSKNVADSLNIKFLSSSKDYSINKVDNSNVLNYLQIGAKMFSINNAFNLYSYLDILRSYNVIENYKSYLMNFNSFKKTVINNYVSYKYAVPSVSGGSTQVFNNYQVVQENTCTDDIESEEVGERVEFIFGNDGNQFKINFKYNIRNIVDYYSFIASVCDKEKNYSIPIISSVDIDTPVVFNNSDVYIVGGVDSYINEKTGEGVGRFAIKKSEGKKSVINYLAIEVVSIYNHEQIIKIR